MKPKEHSASCFRLPTVASASPGDVLRRPFCRFARRDDEAIQTKDRENGLLRTSQRREARVGAKPSHTCLIGCIGIITTANYANYANES